MKKYFIITLTTLVSLFIVSSCTSKQDTTASITPEFKTYTLTVTAEKSISTKQLVLDGNTLNAVWGKNDVVDVYAKGSKVGTISPLTTGSATAVLSGEVTFPVSTFNVSEDYVDLVLGGDLSGQDGSLTNIKDWAKAWFKVESITETAIVPKGDVVFNNWTSIVRFNVKKGGSELNVSNMTINVKDGSPAGFTVQSSYKYLTVTPTQSTNQLYVSLSNLDNNGDAIKDTYVILVTSAEDNKVYSCLATKTLAKGSFYDITLNVKETYTVAGNQGIFTSYWDPTDTSNDLVYSSETKLYSKEYSVPASCSLSFKVVRNHAWNDSSWPEQDKVVSVPAGKITINYNPDNNNVTVVINTRKITAGVIEHLSQDDEYYVHYWGGSAEGNEKLTATGETSKKSVGSSYWEGAEQKFYMYTAEIPGDCTGFKITDSNENWYGGDGSTSSHSSVYIWEYNYGKDHLALYE